MKSNNVNNVNSANNTNNTRKWLSILCAVLGICFIVAGVAFGIRLGITSLHSNKSEDYLETFREEIRNSPSITMEYSEDEEAVLVEADASSLSNYFIGLELVESEEEVTQWTYRVTFNSKPVVLGDEEIVVLVGENSLSIDGHSYTTPSDGVSIAGVMEYLDVKYSYYKSQEAATE